MALPNRLSLIITSLLFKASILIILLMLSSFISIKSILLPNNSSSSNVIFNSVLKGILSFEITEISTSDSSLKSPNAKLPIDFLW